MAVPLSSSNDPVPLEHSTFRSPERGVLELSITFGGHSFILTLNDRQQRQWAAQLTRAIADRD
jgi:hypothetical protein